MRDDKCIKLCWGWFLKKKTYLEWLVLYESFHENHQFFKVFEIVGIGGTLTLFLFYFFQIQNRWFSYSKIFKN
jgi:hypothetical protein